MPADPAPENSVTANNERQAEIEADDRDELEAVARLFHDTYERLAPDFGYRTREASAKPWDEVPERNRALMIATVAAVLPEIGIEMPRAQSGAPGQEPGDSVGEPPTELDRARDARGDDDPMPVFTIKAKDNLAPAAVEAYRALCVRHDLAEQAHHVEDARDEIVQWRLTHPDLCKWPDHKHVPAARSPQAEDHEVGIEAALDDFLPRYVHRWEKILNQADHRRYWRAEFERLVPFLSRVSPARDARPGTTTVEALRALLKDARLDGPLDKAAGAYLRESAGTAGGAARRIVGAFLDAALAEFAPGDTPHPTDKENDERRH